MIEINPTGSLETATNALGHNNQDPINFRYKLLVHLSLVCFFLFISLLTWWRIWITSDPRTTMLCACGDAGQSMWFLAWPAYALSHGQNLFLTHLVYAGQGGANLLDNTSWLSVGVLLTPVTDIFGPIASFNVAVLIGPVVSGWTMFLLLRKITRFLPGQILGALLYGFSPFVLTNNAYGAFGLTFLFFPPLVFLCIYDLVITHKYRPDLMGLFVGVLIVVQFFTGAELLTITLLATVFGLLFAVLLKPRVFWLQRRSLLVACGVAGSICFIFLAYPLWFMIDGPRHFTGIPQIYEAFGGLKVNAVVVTGGKGAVTLFGDSSLFTSIGVNSSYLGIWLLGFIAVSSLFWYRIREAWLALFLAVLAWSFSLGIGFESDHPKLARWWYPWEYLRHVPILSDIYPPRFAVITYFGVAILLAVSLDQWFKGVKGATCNWQTHEHKSLFGISMPVFRRLCFLLLCIVGVTSVLPIATSYSLPYPVRKIPMDQWFSHAALKVKTGSTLLLPLGSDASTIMDWQAIDRMRIRLVGGYIHVPGPNGESEYIDPPTGAQAVLLQLSTGIPRMPSGSYSQLLEVRRFLAKLKISLAVVLPTGSGTPYQLAYYTALFGQTPTRIDHAWEWTAVSSYQTPPIHISAQNLEKCSNRANLSKGLAISYCVLAYAG